MARDEITLIKPEADASASVEVATAEATTVNAGNGICVKKAFDCKNNSLHITVNNTGSTSTITLVAGDKYPNTCLGNLEVAVASGTTVVMVDDMSRFETKDGDLNIDFGSGFTGTIYAVAKRAGLKPVA